MAGGGGDPTVLSSKLFSSNLWKGSNQFWCEVNALNEPHICLGNGIR